MDKTNNQKEYTVVVKVEGRALVTVTAKNAEEARTKANNQVCNMDFGELTDIDWDAVYSERSDGVRVDY